jgi:hypothetical protein
MAKRLAQRTGRRKRSHRVGEDENMIPINRETAEIIAQQKRLFREQFGRDPGLEDPLFFDPGDATPQFLSDESADEVWSSLLQAAGDSRVDPALVYAMNKTGRIVTETNLQFLTDAELQEWNDAVQEYHRKIESSQPQQEPKEAVCLPNLIGAVSRNSHCLTGQCSGANGEPMATRLWIGTRKPSSRLSTGSLAIML